MTQTKRRVRLTLNSPAILIFVAACVIARLIADLTGGRSNTAVFSVYRSSFADPLTYVRLFGHVIGHADWNHLFGNMMYILILGPMIEEKYGTANTVFVMLVTALVTGLVNILLFPDTILLGASGIVFSLIMMASITTIKEDGQIPVTFVLVAILYIGQQIYQGIFQQDNISQLTHIVGGIVGSALAFVMQKARRNSY